MFRLLSRILWMCTEKPLVAMTMGDPAGIGPEVIAAVWQDERVPRFVPSAGGGESAGLRAGLQIVCPNGARRHDRIPGRGPPAAHAMPCIPACQASAADVPPGVINAHRRASGVRRLGRCSAVTALANRIDAIVTAPLSKAALWQAGHHYPGHTELLAELCGVDDFAMMLYLADAQVRGPSGLGVIHTTLHISLRGAIAALEQDAVLAKIELAHDSMRPLTGAPPRIGVCALNPHAGEEGLFGDEESRIIAPAVRVSANARNQRAGPLPCRHFDDPPRDGEFDAVVAMYHDQGHIALKLLGMHRAVNVTLGLPIIRTSVAHGTAFDIAWRGVARTTSMIEALRVACQLVASRAPSDHIAHNVPADSK